MSLVLAAANASRISAATITDSFGYGFVMIGPETANPHAWGFSWMKVFNGPNFKPPANTLYLIPVSAADVGNLPAVVQRVDAVMNQYGANIDAYEIGNEVNLSSTFGWNASPVAADYAQVLCAAFNRIKANSPTTLVVSAGLANTGRVSGTYGGHPGNNGASQDEREYLTELIAANAGSCLDFVGYHPFGFSADFDATPDATGGTPETDCLTGLCFRSAEGLHDVMQNHGWGAKKMWATEMGWLIAPPSTCSTDATSSDWSNRTWQAVTPIKQATNLAGAFNYARANWPWMNAMFVFNLNFNMAPYYDMCNQMRYYSVLGNPAEAALRGLFNWYYMPVMMR
ncbi:MAG TPA: hypothetical protein VGK87_14780 [Anaerolineae bacterium]